ncbi:MAG: 50S ribosomal protein L9 [Planctomycetes bacterium]|nr:50S ribosomal protein L9 [Planctomycetota bacterium]
MDIILLENIEPIGIRGDIVNVKTGYARNYLIPRGLGAEVTAENLRKLDGLKKKLRQEEMERMGMLRELAARLNSISLTIQAKVSEEGHLFGSVNPAMVHGALLAEGVELEPKSIRLEENIKEVGVYTVPIHLHAEIQAKVRLWVVEEREDGHTGQAKEALGSEVEPETES